MTLGADIGRNSWRHLALGRGFHAYDLPQVQVVGPWHTRRPTRKAILGSRFYVYGRAEKLRPPINWRQDPHGSRTWRYELHTLTWLKEALARHAIGGDVETLAVAWDVVLDWARAHLRADEEDVSEFAWYDMAIGLRAPYIAYVLRAGLAAGMLVDEDVELLVAAAERHGTELVDRRNYAAGNNHGLFQDEGLYLLARLLPGLPAADAWRELALTRLRRTLRETVSFEDGAHLEHSPAYQLAIIDLVSRLASNVRELPELADLLDRMRRTAAWQTTPTGHIAQLGDSDSLPAPTWARDAAAALRGVNGLFEAGQAFAREGHSYLAVSAAYHGAAHKHADDTGLLLIEDGEVLLGDAGRWGYYEDEPDRLYARSAAAHNVLTVDGQEFAWRRTEPYGSGLIAADEVDGWYEIAVRNPLLHHQGVDHLRVILYRPGEMLIVLDDVRSDDEHDYVRHFHFGPNVEAGADNDGIRLTGRAIAASFAEILDKNAELALVGKRENPRLGWTYPGDRKRHGIWTAVLRSRAVSATFTVALTLRGKPPTARSAPITRALSLLDRPRS